MRIAAAPISWGVCEVPGWGYQLDPAQVLTEMVELGITATEFGPQGWLPEEPAARAEAIGEYGLQAVGAFVPLVLHDPAHDPVPEVERELDSFEATGGDVLVVAADSGLDGYDERPDLDDAGWQTLLTNLDRVTAAANARGIRVALHPHVGTMIENREEVERVLAGCEVPLCLDTGHLLIGGTNPTELVDAHTSRIEHVHVKDVRIDLAEQVQTGALAYTEAVRQGIYVPLGQGDVDFAHIVSRLNDAGYDGWYVIEQDTILASAADAAGSKSDVERSISFLHNIAS